MGDNRFDELLDHPDHILEFGDIKLKVKEDVFSPDPQISCSTSMILDALPDLKGKSIVDMGTGTGVIAVHCSKKGAVKITATDISQKALDNARENFAYNNVQGELVDSYLFDNLSGFYDYIFANLPISDKIWKSEETSMSLLKKFLSQAKHHLNKGGKIFLPWFSISNINEVKQLIKEDYSYEEIVEEKFGFVWSLFILNVD